VAAGDSAERLFRKARRDVVRRGWREWAATVALLGGVLALVAVTEGVPQLLLAATSGFLAAILMAGWLIGDVRALPYRWGAQGERQTAELLEQLDPTWSVEHDVPSKRGNWDHVLTGPAGTFMVDSKTLSRPAKVVGDALVCGRSRWSGVSFRAAAAELSRALAQEGRRPFVRAVVVIWGDFPQRHVEGDRITFIEAKQLVPWLESAVRDRK
jgi:hypothetical protein